MFVVKDYAFATKGSEHVVYRHEYVLSGLAVPRRFQPVICPVLYHLCHSAACCHR